jgi:hypothetical protein
VVPDVPRLVAADLQPVVPPKPLAKLAAVNLEVDPAIRPVRSRVARWDVSTWTPVFAHSQTPNYAPAMKEFRGDLYVGESFTTIGGQDIRYIARAACGPMPPCPSDCNGDGCLDVADFGYSMTKFARGCP